ncbi:MAG TPA: antibiotic biosynthesis monooxygenase [Noviherbaspirillum sp.]|jgi:heme-degrading monooxygenase HmoA|uniref:antibiotic biosynthesis monooxygenase family protein n=1 Tax=Noviherbaspirillum sp. TaxID=1926288 RepID=UPI002F950DC4
MYAVVFEVLPTAQGYQRYLDIAAALRPQLDGIDGFISIERFRCTSEAGWILSLSQWRDESALVRWRQHGEHHAAQAEGRAAVFDDYRIRVVRFEELPVAGAPRLGLREHGGEAAGGFRRRFASLADAGRRIDLLDDGVLTGDSRLGSDIRWGTVIRDYGMRARAQAPQHFPLAPPARRG